MREFAGGGTIDQLTEQESLLVEVTDTIGAEGVSTAQNVEGRDF